MLYLDTSALLKLYVRESGSEWVQRTISEQDEPLPVWEVQECELINALHLKVFWGELTSEQAKEQLGYFHSRKRRGLYVFPDLDRSALMERFRELSQITMVSGCRTMDILHVSCALEIDADLFVSFDKRQLDLARKSGLPVTTFPVS